MYTLPINAKTFVKLTQLGLKPTYEICLLLDTLKATVEGSEQPRALGEVFYSSELQTVVVVAASLGCVNGLHYYGVVVA